MATIYSPESILKNNRLVNATVSKIFVDLKDTGEIPHAEVRLVLAEDQTDKWNCSIGSNPGAVVNADSRYDITLSVQASEVTLANILMSFEFQPRLPNISLIGVVNGLSGTLTELGEYLDERQDMSNLEKDLLQFSRFGLRGSRDIVVQWVIRLCLLKMINNKAHRVVMPPGLRLRTGMQPLLDFGKFIAKNYTTHDSYVTQSTEDDPIHRGWLHFEYDRSTGIDGSKIPYISAEQDEEHFRAKTGARMCSSGSAST